MIVQLVNERNNNNNEKDKKIKELKVKHHVIKQDQFKQEEKIEQLRREVLWTLFLDQSVESEVPDIEAR